MTAPCTNYILLGHHPRGRRWSSRARTASTRWRRPFRAEQLREADEIFVTGTSSGIVPIVTLDGATVGTGRVGPVTRRLMELYELRTRGENALAQAASPNPFVISASSDATPNAMMSTLR